MSKDYNIPIKSSIDVFISKNRIMYSDTKEERDKLDLEYNLWKDLDRMFWGDMTDIIENTLSSPIKWRTRDGL